MCLRRRKSLTQPFFQEILELPKIIEKLKQETISNMAKEICDSISPSAEFNEVKSWLEETSEAKELLDEKEISLRGLKDIRSQLKLAWKDGMLQGEELFSIAEVINVADEMRQMVQENQEIKEKYPKIVKLIKGLPGLSGVKKEIYDKIENNGVIKDAASSQLKSIRQKIKTHKAQVKQSLNKTLQRGEKYLQEQLVTLRNDRYVIPVRAESKEMIPGVIHDQSSSGMTVYIEPKEVVELNNKLQQLQRDEKQEIERILRFLSGLIKENHDYIQDLLQILVELDFVVAKGYLARKMKGREPELNREKQIRIVQGTHPLLGEGAVPVDVSLGETFTTMVITGPNTGGKTVTLKMVGLFTLMTQVGLHIPVERGTEMGIFEKVFADIGDEQDIEQSLSTFSSHMTKIVKIVEQVNQNSLVLLDEIGAGTDPTEGSALAMGLLDYFHEMNARTIATTHFSQLKNYAHARKNVENASVEFDEKTLQPTYKLRIGIPGKSNAFIISRRLGLKEEIIHRAKSFLAEEEIEVENLISSLSKKEKATQALKEDLEKEKIKLDEEKHTLKEERETLKQKRSEVLKKAHKQAEEIISAARRDAEESLKEARKLAEQKSQREMAEISSKVRQRLDSRYEAIQDALNQNQQEQFSVPKMSPEEMKPGTEVWVKSINKNGTIQNIDWEKEEAEVQVGIMKVTVSFDDVYKLLSEVKSEGSNQSSRATSAKVLANKKEAISTEIDVRGETVEEATSRVEKYLDDAAVSGLKQINIIHGKGTGSLRKGIQFHLEGHPLVHKYRIGNRNEGGEGVTVVELSPAQE